MVMRAFPKNTMQLNIFLWKYVMKFEIGRRLFENFRKLEDGVSKFSNIPFFGRNQMNEPSQDDSYGALQPMCEFQVLPSTLA